MEVWSIFVFLDYTRADQEVAKLFAFLSIICVICKERGENFNYLVLVETLLVDAVCAQSKVVSSQIKFVHAWGLADKADLRHFRATTRIWTASHPNDNVII